MPNELATKAYVQDYVEKIVKGSNSLVSAKNADTFENKWDSDAIQTYYGAKNILKLSTLDIEHSVGKFRLKTNPTSGTCTINGTKLYGGANEVIITGKMTPKTGKYILSLVADADTDYFQIYIRKYNGNDVTAAKPSDTIDIDYDGYDSIDIRLSVLGEYGKSFDNVTIYPMMRLASIKDTTFAPYAQTNTELTSSVNVISSNITEEQQRITANTTNITKNTNDITKLNNNLTNVMAYMGIYGDDVLGLQVDYVNYIYKRLAAASNLTAGANFNNVSPWKDVKRCNLADDGTVNAYYGQSGYTEDGSNGQVMVEIPKFYYFVMPLETEPIGDSVGGLHLRKANYYISPTKHDGFKTHPFFIRPDGTERDKAYISAYEGCIYDVSESAYILNDAQTADFATITGDKLSSIAGAKPCSGRTQSLTMTHSETLAANRSAGWHCMDVKAISVVQLLFMIEYGTLNSQNVIGLGVANKWNDGSSQMSEIAGATSNLGNSTGMASGTDGLVSVSYRGVENPYGNIWKFVEGLTLWGDGTLRGGQPYICDDYTFTEGTKTGYTAVKFTVSNTSDYISAFGYDPDFDWLFLPSECVNADSNYPVGDLGRVTSDLNGYSAPHFGGAWYYGLQTGAFYWSLDAWDIPNYRTAGARLMYVS